MAEADPDWLALQIANAQSPFRTFQKPDAPFESYATPQTVHEQFGAHAQPNPHPDLEYSTKNIKDIQEHQRRPNLLRDAFRWIKGIIPHGHETADRQSLSEAMANPRAVGVAERLADAPARALNLAAGMAEAIAGSGQETSEAFGHAMRGENRPGTGFAGTGITEPTMLVPAQAAAGFIPGLSRLARVGEAKPTSTYDKVRAKLEESPLFNWERPGVLGDRGLPLPGAPTLPSIWPGPEFLPETGPAWKHQANPFSEEAGRIRGHLKSLTGEETWPKAPPFEDTSPLGPNGSKSMNAEMGRPGNERDVGEVKLRADEGDKAAPFVASDRDLQLRRGKRALYGLEGEPYRRAEDYSIGGLPLDRAQETMNYVAQLRRDAGGTGEFAELARLQLKRMARYGDIAQAKETIDRHHAGPQSETYWRGLEDFGKAEPPTNPFKLNADGDAKLAPFARRTEPLPLTQGVADWVKEATGKEPSLRVARGKNETDYVGLPHGPQERERGLERTKVRVADDGHAGWPEKGLIDTAGAKPGRTDPDVLSRLNAEGQPFSNYQNLIDALKWATSSSPGGGNWLVAPGKEPRWARYAKEEPAPKSIEGADFSPEQLKLLAKTGDKHLNFGAALGGHTNIGTNMPDADFWITRRGAADKLGEVSREFNPESFGVLNRNHQISPDYLYYALQHMKNQGYYQGRGHGTTNLQNIRLKDVEDIPIQPSDFQLWAKNGGDLKTMLAAARGDPDKLASIRKTIESLKGVSPGGIAKVLETQHGLDVHPGDVPQVLRELDRNRFSMPNQSRPSLQSRIDKAYEHTRPGPRSIRSEPGFPQRFWEAWDRHQGHQQKVADELGVSQSTVYGWKSQIPRPSPQTPEGAAAEAARFSAQRAEVGKRTLDAGNRYRGGRSFMNDGKRELTPQEPLLGKKAPSRVEALREQRSQGQASEAELAKRGGKPFWDETGRARAQKEDFEAIKRLFPAKGPKDDTTLFARGRPWLEAEIGHAHQLHKQMTDEGRSMQWLADQLGRSKASVQSLMEREGLKSPLRQGGLKDESLAALKEAEERGIDWKPTYEHGDTSRSIAIERGLHRNTLYQLLKRRAAKSERGD